jgi:hypothetical protein
MEVDLEIWWEMEAQLQREQATQGYVEDGKVYDEDYRLKYRIEGDKIYDRDWNPKGRIEGKRIYDEKWNLKGRIKKGK